MCYIFLLFLFLTFYKEDTLLHQKSCLFPVVHIDISPPLPESYPCILFQSDSPRLLSCSTSYYRQQYIFADTTIIAGTVSPVSFCPFIKGFCPFYFGCSMNCAFGLLREKQYQQFSNNLFRAFSVMIETSLLNYIILQPDPNKIDRRY